MKKLPIVTLSVVCILKWLLHSHVKTVDTLYKRSKQTMHYVYLNSVKTKIKASIALDAMFVDTVDTKHMCIFLLNTFFLIFNGFSIQKKF